MAGWNDVIQVCPSKPWINCSKFLVSCSAFQTSLGCYDQMEKHWLTGRVVAWQCCGHGSYNHCWKLVTGCWDLVVFTMFQVALTDAMFDPFLVQNILIYFVGLPSDGGEQRRRKDGVFRRMPLVLVQGFGWPWRWRQTCCCRECRTWMNSHVCDVPKWSMTNDPKHQLLYLVLRCFEWSDGVTVCSDLVSHGIPQFWSAPVWLWFITCVSHQKGSFSHSAKDDLSWSKVKCPALESDHHF